MAIQKFNTRLQLKYDLYSNWTTNNPVLLAGEVAIATIPVAEGATSLNHNSVALPQVLIKVGDGTSHYNTLPFASALAADVHPWAKETETQFAARVETLITNSEFVKANLYTKTEIDAFLANYYTKTEVDAKTGDLTKLNTTHKADLVGAINEALQAVEVGGTGSVVSVVKEETATEGSLATYKVTQGGNAVGALIEVVKDTALDSRVATIEGDYLKAADIANFETKENVKKVADDLAAYVTSNDEALAGVKATAEAARTETQVDAQIDAKITALDLANTYEAKGAAAEVAGDLAEYQEANDAAVALKADQTALDSTNTELATLKGRVDTFFEGTGASDVIDTLEDLINYINTHDDVEISGILADIQALEDKMAGIDSTVVAYVTAAIEALKIGDYAKASDLTDLAARVKAIEDAPYATTANVATAKQEAIDDAAAKYETIGTAQGIVDALNIAQYETIAGAADKYEAKGTAEALVNGLGIADYLKSADAATTYETKTDAAAKLAEAKAHTDDSIAALNVTQYAKDADLAAIAKTGNINDLVQTENDYVVFYCGDSAKFVGSIA